MATATSRSLPRRLVAITVLGALAAALLWYEPWQTLIVLVSPLSYPFLAMGLCPGIWLREGEPVPDLLDDLERRRPVWRALSELYLDTELCDADHARIASVLLESGYSAEQLEEILYLELHPVLHANLLSVAGEWAGFDEPWLEQRILGRGRRRSGFAVVLGKWMVHRSWLTLRARL